MTIICKTLYSVWTCLLYFTNTTAQYSRTNFVVKRFEVCNNNRGIMKFSGNVTREHGNQYLTCNLTTPIPWDDYLGLYCLIETEVVKDIFAELFIIREKNWCKAANMFLGEFWYDLERAAQLPCGTCPIPPGKYIVHHLKLDFTKVTLQTFPFGTIRFTFKGVDNRNKNADMLCLLLEVENKMM